MENLSILVLKRVFSDFVGFDKMTSKVQDVLEDSSALEIDPIKMLKQTSSVFTIKAEKELAREVLSYIIVWKYEQQRRLSSVLDTDVNLDVFDFYARQDHKYASAFKDQDDNRMEVGYIVTFRKYLRLFLQLVPTQKHHNVKGFAIQVAARFEGSQNTYILGSNPTSAVKRRIAILDHELSLIASSEKPDNVVDIVVTNGLRSNRPQSTIEMYETLYGPMDDPDEPLTVCPLSQVHQSTMERWT
jgi:hypothetical protein